MSRDGRRRAWREFSYYPEQEETEGLYSGLEISEYSDYGNGGNNSINANSDYASPVTEELLLSPLSQRSLEHCEELELDPGEREQDVGLLLFFKWESFYSILADSGVARNWFDNMKGFRLDQDATVWNEDAKQLQSKWSNVGVIVSSLTWIAVLWRRVGCWRTFNISTKLPMSRLAG